MSDRNVQRTEPSVQGPAEPAGYEQSIGPLGKVTPPGERANLPTDEDSSIAERTGRDPGNLGDDIPDRGDLVHPSPADSATGRTPGM